MAITPTPESVSIVVGYKATVSVVSNEGNITSVVSSDASVATVSANLGGPTSDIVITAVHGFNASQSPATINIQVFTASGSINIPVTVSGVTTGFVGSKLGFFSDDIGQLCMSDRVNKWSKWKPTKSTNPLTGSILQTLKYALIIPESGWSGIRTWANGMAFGDTMDQQIKWAYDQPGISDLKRIDDFKGYQHGSVPIFAPQKNTPNEIYYDDYAVQWLWDLDVEQTRDILDGALSAENFSSGWTLGVMFISASGTIAILAINDANIITQKGMQVDLTDLATARYWVCFFIKQTTGGTPQLNNPSDAEVAAITGSTSWIPIEDGMVEFNHTSIVIPVTNNHSSSSDIRIGWKIGAGAINWTPAHTVGAGSTFPFIIFGIPVLESIVFYLDSTSGQNFYAFSNNQYIGQIADMGYFVRTPFPLGYQPSTLGLKAMLAAVKVSYRVVSEKNITVRLYGSTYDQSKQGTAQGTDVTFENVPLGNTFSIMVSGDAGGGNVFTYELTTGNYDNEYLSYADQTGLSLEVDLSTTNYTPDYLTTIGVTQNV